MIESVQINEQKFVGKGKILAKQAIANERPVVVIKQSFVFCKTDGGEATRRQDGNMRRIVRSIGNTNLQGIHQQEFVGQGHKAGVAIEKKAQFVQSD